MPKRQTITNFGEREGELKAGVLRQAIIAGGAAGEHTVSGIAVGDELVAVTRFDVDTGNVVDVDDLSDEFSITDADTIDNTDGTATTGDVLQVWWIDRT